ncbi:maker478 [Drosophila busckii]|uniref:Maker478 n=1 Tax=Drosophila busckii TaxID=30019 RepID=A0A0M3QTR5_DROBS|nr:maker478 [Drosophila busckii]
MYNLWRHKWSKVNFNQRRKLIKQLIQSFNVVLVALLMYNLWRHKWSKVNFN